MDYNYHTYCTMHRAFAGRVQVFRQWLAPKNPATSISVNDGESSVVPEVRLVGRTFEVSAKCDEVSLRKQRCPVTTTS